MKMQKMRKTKKMKERLILEKKPWSENNLIRMINTAAADDDDE